MIGTINQKKIPRISPPGNTVGKGKEICQEECTDIVRNTCSALIQLIENAVIQGKQQTDLQTVY